MTEQNEQNEQKGFQWLPEDVFTFTGMEYSILINSLREILSSPESQKVLLAQQAYVILSKKLEDSVSSGLVKELETSPEAMPVSKLISTS